MGQQTITSFVTLVIWKSPPSWSTADPWGVSVVVGIRVVAVSSVRGTNGDDRVWRILF